MEGEDYESNPMCLEPEVIVKCEEPDELDPLLTESVWIKHEICDELEEEKFDGSEENFIQIKSENGEGHIDRCLDISGNKTPVGLVKVEPVNVEGEVKEELDLVDEQRDQQEEEVESDDEEPCPKQFNSMKDIKRDNRHCTEDVGGTVGEEDCSKDLKKSQPFAADWSNTGLQETPSCIGKIKCILHPFKCAIHSLPTHLERKIKKKTTEKRFKCDICPYSCPYACTLRRHMETHELLKSKALKCSFCPYKTKLPAYLERHMVSHDGEKPIKCSLCCYSCKESGELKQHMAGHDGMKPIFKCKLCPYTSSRAYDTKTHMSTHIETKLYRCTKCSYSTCHKNTLKEHMKRHLGEKNFQCGDCGLKSVTKRGLCLHIKRKHTGEKNFKCTLCGYKFPTNYQLTKHMRQRHHQ